MKLIPALLLLVWLLSAVEVRAERPPRITTHPESQLGRSNTPLTLTVEVEGTAPFTYQWYRDGSAIASGTGRTLTITPPASGQSMVGYDVTVFNALGAASSRTAYIAPYPSLFVNPGLTGYFALGLGDQNARPLVGKAGRDASITAFFTGSPQPTVQWYRNGVAIPGATQAALYLDNPQPTSEPIVYSARATNSIATIDTAAIFPVTIIGNPTPPIVDVYVRNHKVTLGSDAELSLYVRGEGPLSYEWSRDGVVVAGATSSTLAFDHVGLAEAGLYRCRVTNPYGSTESSLIFLSVNDPPRLSNLSIRARTGNGVDVLIVGFVIGHAGSGNAPFFLARAAGPALRAFGVNDAVADPQIDIYRGNTLIGGNDNWGGGASLAETARRVGAFAFTDPNSRDAMHLTSFSPGSYTLQVPAKNNEVGVVLAEIYDTATSSESTTANPRLTNLSARAQVGTGENILIAGFAVAGQGTQRVLIRAAGPVLAGFGVTGALQNPQLKLYRGSDVLAENDDWKGTAELVTAMQAVGAFAWNDPASRDAALLATLAPGAYSVQVSGINNTTGLALIEVYELP